MQYREYFKELYIDIPFDDECMDDDSTNNEVTKYWECNNYYENETYQGMIIFILASYENFYLL